MEANPVVEVRQAKRRITRRMKVSHSRLYLTVVGPVELLCREFPQYAEDLLRAQTINKATLLSATSQSAAIQFYPKTGSAKVWASSEEAARDDPRFQRFMQAAMSGPDVLEAEV